MGSALPETIMPLLLYSLVMVLGASGTGGPMPCATCLFTEAAISSPASASPPRPDIAPDGQATPIAGVVAPEGLEHLFPTRPARRFPEACDTSLLVSGLTTGPDQAGARGDLAYRPAAQSGRGPAMRSATILSERSGIGFGLGVGCSL